jgi:hypothetical protein
MNLLAVQLSCAAVEGRVSKQDHLHLSLFFPRVHAQISFLPKKDKDFFHLETSAFKILKIIFM